MPIITALVVTVATGVLTATVLALFSNNSEHTSNAVITQRPMRQRPRQQQQRQIAFGELARFVLAVTGGVAVALVAGHVLIDDGVIPKGVPSHLGLLVIGTILCWQILTVGRRDE